MKKTFFLIAAGLLAGQVATAQDSFRWPWNKKKKVEKVVAPAAPTQAPPQQAGGKSTRPFSQVITAKAKHTAGLLSVYQVDDKYYFQIPDSILGRDMLVVSRIAQSAANNRSSQTMLGYAGDMIGRNIIRFDKKDDKIYLRSISYSERSSDSTGMMQSVKNSNIQPIISSFDVKTYKEEGKSKHPVIDFTDVLRGDNSTFFFDPQSKKALNLGGMAPDRSYIDTVRSYPTNVEIRTTKTYGMGMGFGTYGLNTSILLLPKNPMKPRISDPRVGYFTVRYTDFDLNPQGVKHVAYATRWRLEPKEEDVQRYLRGELVEPKKPIVFYIDPATPKKWIPYLKAGVNDWQEAFEQAGFKNAIYAVEVSEKDTAWSIDDARHSAIVYKPSTIPNASGPHVNDPRTGEILESHINWYHNVMNLLRNWYFIQASPLDKRAQKLTFDDELMGQLIRFVSSHEVGHTLGLRHNFGSSATVPVEKLRDKAWVEANGHTPSIMDYARFNFVAQPEDNISEKGIFPRIGIYDKWAIEWGYRWFPNYETPQQEVPTLDKMVTAKLKEDVRYTFGSEMDPNDPRNQNEDLGDNAMKASYYGIKNLKRIIPNLRKWTSAKNEFPEETHAMYNEIVRQFGRYMGHVARNIGGIYTTPRKTEENKPITEYTPASTQREAMAFLNENLFKTPTWLINKELVDYATVDPVDAIASIQLSVLGRLQNSNTINKLARFEYAEGAKAYTPQQMFNDLRKGVWPHLTTHKSIDLQSRLLQKAYIENFRKMIEDKTAGGVDDSKAVSRAQLSKLRTEIRAALPSMTGASREHLEECLARIAETLDKK